MHVLLDILIFWFHYSIDNDLIWLCEKFEVKILIKSKEITQNVQGMNSNYI